VGEGADVGVPVGVAGLVGVGLGVVVGLGLFVGFGVLVGLGVLVGFGVLVGLGVFVGFGVLVGLGALFGWIAAGLGSGAFSVEAASASVCARAVLTRVTTVVSASTIAAASAPIPTSLKLEGKLA